VTLKRHNNYARIRYDTIPDTLVPSDLLCCCCDCSTVIEFVLCTTYLSGFYRVSHFYRFAPDVDDGEVGGCERLGYDGTYLTRLLVSL